ncbi:MAG: hypothetical protein J5I93_02235 [Pirellulaceae bacterium]|nr:hypothetical protein [Pirellulaceae bacterium]
MDLRGGVPGLELREGFIADGPPGLDTVVMCARRTPLPDSVDLRPLLGNISQAEFHHESEVVWLELRDEQPTADYFRKPMNRGILVGSGASGRANRTDGRRDRPGWKAGR